MSSISVREVRGAGVGAVIPLLLLAEESEPALRWSLAHMADAVYRVDLDTALVGAMTMRWQGAVAEILELGVAPAQQGRGLGRQIVAWLADAAQQRGKRQLIVGTGNSSLGNIAFYQKCGMRMDHVRPDYFGYYRSPVYEHGIQKRDLLVFRLDLTAAAAGSRG